MSKHDRFEEKVDVKLLEDYLKLESKPKTIIGVDWGKGKSKTYMTCPNCRETFELVFGERE